MNQELTQHHDFSPSKLPRYAECPWSYRMCQGWNEPDSTNSGRGRAMHAAVYDDAELSNLNEVDRKIVMNIRETHVSPYLKFQHNFEFPVDIFSEDGKKISSGIVDFLVISDDVASIKDWKFGGTPVPAAEENEQIWGYVCGVFQKFKNLQKVYALIVQPAFGMENYEKQAEFRREQLPELLRKIEKIETDCQNATEADAVPSGDRCRYCNYMRCGAFRRRMEENFSAVHVAPEQLPPPELKMTVEFADRVLMAEREIVSFMKNQSDPARKFLLENGGSENFRVSVGKSTTAIDWEGLAKKYQISKSDIEEFTVRKVGNPFLSARRKPLKQLDSESGTLQ